MYSLFLFDIDGTLIDTERTGVLSLMDTARNLLGIELRYEDAYGYFGIPSLKVGSLLGYDDPLGFGEEWEANFIRLSYLIKPFEGIAQTLSALKSDGCRIGCVTSRNRFEFEKDVHLSKIVHFFDQIVCAEDSERHKPYPDPIFACLHMMESRMGHTPQLSECIYVGDTMHDCQCAHAAGVDFALADWKDRGMQDIPAEYHLKKVADIQTLPHLHIQD